MSVSLNGNVANYLSIASSLGGMTLASAKTICGWFKPANTNANKCAFRTDGWKGSGIQFRATAAATSWDQDNNYLTDIGTYTANTWYYVFIRRSSSSFSYEYGWVPSGGSSVTYQGAIGTSDTSTLTGLYLGVYDVSGTKWDAWNGEICCVRVFSSQLSDAAILQEKAGATPVNTGTLVANWRLATNSDLTSTVNSYALTATGTVSTGSTEPTDIAGASGVAVPILMSHYQ